MKDFFKPEDFADYQFSTVIAHDAAAMANAKLEKLIESWPVVYINKYEASKGWHFDKNQHDTHRARLAFIESIKECEHRVAMERMGNGRWTIHTHPDGTIRCGKCGVEVKDVKWEAVK